MNDHLRRRSGLKAVPLWLGKGILVLSVLIWGSKAFTLHAQEGRVGAIRGMILDADFGDPLPGARINVQELDRQAQSETGGTFIIEEVPPGVYSLAISKSGFNKQFRRDIVVTEGKLADVTIELVGQVFELEELVVTGSDLVAGSEVALLELRQETSSLIDSVGSELISQAGASDAADALKQVVGATVADGKFATVRGLADRYTKTVVNGQSVPSPNPARRAVELDIFPASTIESIEVSKTFTPDLPGDSTGGLVNVKLKSIPEDRILKFSGSIGANSKTTMKSTFPTREGGGVNWTAVDGGERDQPAPIFNDAGDFPVPDVANFPGGVAGVPAGFPRPTITRTSDGVVIFTPTDQEIAATQAISDHSKLFNPNIAVTRETRGPDYGFSFTLGDKLLLNEEGTAKVGALASFTYGQKYRFRSGDVTNLQAQENVVGGIPQNPRINVAESSIRDVGTDEVSWAALTSFGFQANEEHNFSVTFTHNQLAEEVATFDFNTENAQTPSLWEITEIIDYTERSLTNIFFESEHQFPALADATLELNMGVSRGSQNQPDTSLFTSFFNPTTDTLIFEPPTVAAAGVETGQRISRNIEELQWQFGADVIVPTASWVEDQEGELKFGPHWEELNRDFDQLVYRYIGLVNDSVPEQGTTITPILPTDTGQTVETNPSGTVELDGLAFFLAPSANDNADYEGRQNIQAFYAMHEQPITPDFKVGVGARVEQTRLKTTVTESAAFSTSLRQVLVLEPGEFGNTTDATIFNLDFRRNDPEVIAGNEPADRIDSEIEEVHFLPAIWFSYEIAENMNLKGAYSQTIARPTFREFAPAVQRDQIGGDLFAGNGDLEISEATNYDIRWEWFPNPGDVFATSFFYKHIEKPIELLLVDGGGEDGEVLFPFNFEDADVWGAEFEIRKNLGFLSDALKYFSLGTNFTLIQSRVRVPDGVQSSVERFGLRRDRQRLQGQPDWIFNANMTYSNPDWGTDFSTFFNWESDSLIAGASGGATTGSFDIYKEANFSLNMTLTQRINEHLKMKISAKNLFDPEIRTVYKIPGAGKRGRSSYHKGMDFSVGISSEW